MYSLKLNDIRKNLKQTNNITINNINKLYEQSIKTENIYKTENINKTEAVVSIENIYKKFLTNSLLETNNNQLPNNLNETISNYTKTEQNKTNSINNIIKLLDINNNLNTKDYYIQGTGNKHSYFESLILSIDDKFQKFCLITDNTSELCNKIMQIQRDISSESVPFIKSNSIIKDYYSKNRIKIKDIPNKLFKNNNADIDEDLKIFLADYYNVNILLINMNNKKYRIINDYNTNNKTLVFIENKYKYEPILSINKSSYNTLIQFIYDNIEKQKILLKSIGPISKYKLSDLHKIATELNISIDYNKNNKIKKKLKKDLYSEIVNNIKDI